MQYHDWVAVWIHTQKETRRHSFDTGQALKELLYEYLCLFLTAFDWFISTCLSCCSNTDLPLVSFFAAFHLNR